MLRVLGMDPGHDGAQIRGRLGVVPQEDNLDTELTVWDNLMIYGRYFDLPRAEIRRRRRGAARVRAAHRPARLARRPALRRDEAPADDRAALINQPEVLLLDEPTTGLDPQARHMLWERLYRLKQNGVTLVLTTHYMDEAEQLCDRLVIMDGRPHRGGGIAAGAGGGARDARSWSCGSRVRRSRDDALLACVRGVARRTGRRSPARVHRRRRPHGGRDRRRRGRAASVLVRRASLEDVFLILTGRTLED